jgi:hypothetical protein
VVDFAGCDCHMFKSLKWNDFASWKQINGTLQVNFKSRILEKNYIDRGYVCSSFLL